MVVSLTIECTSYMIVSTMFIGLSMLFVSTVASNSSDYTNVLKDFRIRLEDGPHLAHTIHQIVTDFKVYKEHWFWALPRWEYESLDFTLGISTSKQPDLIKPYPNWQWQEKGNCNALQSVQSFEIDPLGRIWVLDSGRALSVSIECPPQLVVFDSMNNATGLYRYRFTHEFVHPSSSNLCAIVLDHEHGVHAYIADDDDEDPGIIVFSLRRQSAWKISRNRIVPRLDRMDRAYFGSIVTLSPASDRQRYLYYTQSFSMEYYNISVDRLRENNVSLDDWQENNWTFPLFTATMDANGHFYFARYNNIKVTNYHLHSRKWEKITVDWHDPINVPRSYHSIDGDGRCWFLSSQPQFFTGTIWRYYTLKRKNASTKNYQYYRNGSAPALPYFNQSLLIEPYDIPGEEYDDYDTNQSPAVSILKSFCVIIVCLLYFFFAI